MGVRVYFGTVVRTAPVPMGGELSCHDWENKKIEGKIPIVPENPNVEQDPNPRGNTRGCRGIQIIDNKVIAANYHTLQFFDLNLNHVKDMSHGLMVGIHEIYTNSGEYIWVASTAIDAALKLDLNSGSLIESFWPREMSNLSMSYHLKPLDIDKEMDNRLNFLSSSHIKHPSHLHLNAIAEWRGHVYALLNSKGLIVDLTNDRVVIEDESLKGGHNLLILDNGYAFVNSNFKVNTVIIYDINKRELLDTIDLLKFNWIKWLYIKSLTFSLLKGKTVLRFRKTLKTARPLFLRGMDIIGDQLFLGLSPASIVCIDWRQKKLLDAYNYSMDIHVCVHGLKIYVT